MSAAFDEMEKAKQEAEDKSRHPSSSSSSFTSEISQEILQEYNIEDDPNYVQRTYLSTTDEGRVVRTIWLPKGTPRWKNQILPFEPGHILH